MNIIYLLLIISLCFIALIAAIFFWTVRSGQYDDLEAEAFKILIDEDHE